MRKKYDWEFIIYTMQYIYRVYLCYFMWEIWRVHIISQYLETLKKTKKKKKNIILAEAGLQKKHSFTITMQPCLIQLR